MFRTFGQAEDYLKSKINTLFAARGQIQDAYGRALLAQARATTAPLKQKANQLVSDLTDLLNHQSMLERRVSQIVPSSWVPQQTGFIPLIIGAGAIAVAGAVYAHLQRVSQQRAVLSMVEKGILTASQATELTKAQAGGGLFGAGGLSGLTSNLSTLAMVGIGAYVLFLVVPMLSRRTS
jgi:hypothetical protein